MPIHAALPSPKAPLTTSEEPLAPYPSGCSPFTNTLHPLPKSPYPLHLPPIPPYRTPSSHLVNPLQPLIIQALHPSEVPKGVIPLQSLFLLSLRLKKNTNSNAQYSYSFTFFCLDYKIIIFKVYRN